MKTQYLIDFPSLHWFLKKNWTTIGNSEFWIFMLFLVRVLTSQYTKFSNVYIFHWECRDVIQCWEWFSRTPNDVPNHWQCILHDSKTNFSFRFLPVIILAYDRDFFGGVVDSIFSKWSVLLTCVVYIDQFSHFLWKKCEYWKSLKFAIRSVWRPNLKP